MPSERDLFANFERMRREMDELFGDVFGGGLGAAAARRLLARRSTSTTSATRRARSCAPSWPACDAAEIELEIRGRELILAGHAARPTAARSGCTSRSRSSTARSAASIALGADVDADAAKATYKDGFLVVELPLMAPAGGPQRCRSRAREGRPR